MSSYQEILSSGIFTVNEVRKMAGLNALTAQDIPTHTHSIGIGSGALNHTQGAERYLHISKIVCSYCSRPNSREHDLCQSCGAPLSAT